MSLLHATWLENIEDKTNTNPVLMLWADQWRIAKPIEIKDKPIEHPFSLSIEELNNWLETNGLHPANSIEQRGLLTLPTKQIQTKSSSTSQWTGLPLQAGEAIPKKFEWWPWEIEGLALTPSEAATWLAQLPLTDETNTFGQELLWWSHLERWVLHLIAKGLWLPQVEIDTNNNSCAKVEWVPLLSHEDERQRLEEFAKRIPHVAKCGVFYEKSNQTIINKFHLANLRPKNNLALVTNLLNELIDIHLRESFKPIEQGIEPLLQTWQKGLASYAKTIELNSEELKRLSYASKNWKERVSGKIQPAKACLELSAPEEGKELWKLNFSLQAEADPNIRVSASTVWEADTKVLQLGEIRVENAGEILLEGLGRALGVFQTIEKGLETATPNSMVLKPDEAFIFIQKVSKKLRKIGVGVILPESVSGGLASRLGIAIQAELPELSKNIALGQKLNWKWILMIGGITLSIKELEILTKKKSSLVKHKGVWVELRSNDLKNAEHFLNSNPSLNLDDALRLTGSKGNTLMKLPVHEFEAGPNLQDVLEKYHKQKSPEPLAAPSNFIGQLRPYQERGLGWLNFLYRFNQGGCLADDMGLGKTIQLLAFVQHLKEENELTKAVLLIAPTSVLTNWKREALKFTPQLSILEHYGPQRSSRIDDLKNRLKKIDIFITSYGLLYRDKDLLQEIEWQGIVLDEAQTIKNPKAKQSQAIHTLSSKGAKASFRFALTGTPIENKISEIWSLMHFLNPKVLGEITFFEQRYQLPIERYGDISSLKELKVRINPFILRRLKTDKSIISDLPKKIELSEWVNLSNEQKSLYNKTVEKALAEISTSPLGKRNGKILGLLTRLKQICNHPALLLKEDNIQEDFAKRSGKVERLIEILEEILETNDRALIFTQFTEWGSLLQSYLQTKWNLLIPFLHGSTRKIDRQAMIDRFQEDPRGPQLFLLSLKAGGIGLNLARANHVIHIDRWWNPAVENQATDRAYRIGQEKSVMVHKFISTGSLEEKINQMIIKKSRLAEDIVGSGEEWLGKLEIKELKKLVSLDQN